MSESAFEQIYDLDKVDNGVESGMITSFVKFTIKGFLAYAVVIKYKKVSLIFGSDNSNNKKSQNHNEKDSNLQDSFIQESKLNINGNNNQNNINYEIADLFTSKDDQ